MRKNVFDDIKEVVKVCKVINEKITEEDLYFAIDHIIRFNSGQRNHLSDQEKELASFLESRGYKIITVYHWIRAIKLPRHLQQQVKSGTLSYKRARLLRRELKKKNSETIEAEILDDIRNYVKSINLKEFIDGAVDNAKAKY